MRDATMWMNLEKGKRLITKDHIYVKTYEMSKICKYREIECRRVVFWEWGEKDRDIGSKQ